MNWRKKVKIFLKGGSMGLADVVPGVSGGTMALITGIYDRLISTIASIDPRIPIHFLKGDFDTVREKVEEIDISFLVTLLFGIGVAFLIASKFILEFLSVFMYAFFFGLVLASGVLIYVSIRRKFSSSVITVGIVGFLFSMFFSLLVIVVSGANLPHNLIISFFSGALAICAMILPGISGAFMLLLVGQYEYMLSALHSFPSSWATILVFGVGAIVGILSFTKPLSYLLENFRTRMMSFLSGLMLGALTLLFYRIYTEFGAYQYHLEIIGIFIAGLIGVSLILVLQKMTGFSSEKSIVKAEE